MRCKLVKVVLLTLLAAALLGCGAEKKVAAPHEKVPKAEAAAAAAAIVNVPAYELEYANIVDGVYDFLANGNSKRLPQQGTTGIYELRDHFNADEAVQHLGYTLLDINNDKVPELIFAFNNNERRGKGYYGKELYAVYTFVDGQVKFVDEGWARSSLELQPDGTLLTRGNISNAEYLLAVHDLLKDGSTRCLRLYFTKAQKGAGGLEVYRSSDGRAFTDGSERMQMTADEFFEMGSELSSYSTEVELLPLHEYKQRGSKFKGLAMPYLHIMGVHELQDPQADLSGYEQVSVPDPFKGADVLFRTNAELQDFQLLDLQGAANKNDDRVLYSKDRLQAGAKLYLHLSSFETIPKNGIAFKDDAGRLRKFAICASGRDGSIYLNEID